MDQKQGLKKIKSKNSKFHTEKIRIFFEFYFILL